MTEDAPLVPGPQSAAFNRSLLEMRLDLRFQERQGAPLAKTQDEQSCTLRSHSFNGDWEHFVGVATHLYLDATPGTGPAEAKAPGR